MAAPISWAKVLRQESPTCWRIPQDYSPHMQVEGIIFSSRELLPGILSDQALEQVVNVAQLPGIVGASLAMPDLHWGYGFPIGGVAAFAMESGVVAPGGVGYDINCGVRLLRTNLERQEVMARREALLPMLYNLVPAGVGSAGKIKLHARELDKVMQQGARWALRQGWGWPEDLERTEDQGQLAAAAQAELSTRARERGATQLGTLGSGNHFIELQAVEEVYDPAVAAVMGLKTGQVTVMIHCGSRGLGHQVCEDFLGVFQNAVRRYGIRLPDRQLACAPIVSLEGQAYLSAMAAAANYAWANRQCITHQIRQGFEIIFGASAERLGLALVYDVCHNIAKIEKHHIGGREQKVCVLRKGASRAFPPGHPDVPEPYRAIGQPVLLPGSMGTASYVCVGTDRGMTLALGSTAHGAGRRLSRQAALAQCRGRSIHQEMSRRGIEVMADSNSTLAEEAPEAYKDIDAVASAVQQAGLVRKVARLKPLAVIKG